MSNAGVTPDAITIFGTVGAVASALVFFTRGAWFTGTMLVWGFVMLDLVDGAVARIGGRSSKFGAVLDSSCDRIADAAVFGSIGWYFARHGQRWMLLAATVVPRPRLAHVLHPGTCRGSRPHARRWASPNAPTG